MNILILEKKNKNENRFIYFVFIKRVYFYNQICLPITEKSNRNVKVVILQPPVHGMFFFLYVQIFCIQVQL